MVIIWGIIIYSSSADEEKKDKIFLSITFIQLVIVHSFMDYFTLPDLPVYYDAFETMKNVSWSQIENYHAEMEIGFRYYMKAVSLVFPNFTLFLLINSILMLFPYFCAIKKYSNFKVISVLAILVTTYNASLYVLRQQLAMGLFLFSFKYIEQKNPWKYSLTILTLYFIHNSALICLPLYYLCQINDKKKYAYTAIITTALCMLSFAFFLQYIGSDLLGYDHYLSGHSKYTETLNATDSIISAFILMLYIYACKKDSFSEGRNRIVLSCLTINFIGNLIAIGNLSLILRMLWYYKMISFLAFPIINEKIENRHTKLSINMLMFFLYIYPVLRSMNVYLINLKYPSTI